jgi:hypothetical protein
MNAKQKSERGIEESDLGVIHKFFRYGIGYIFRWVFIGLAFIYLISLTIALHEAIGFQRSVEGMFTEKSTAQRVLVELYNHVGAQGSTLEKTYPVPIGTMAIRLDTLKYAVKELSNFQLKERIPAPDNNHNASQGDWPDEFKTRIGDLQPALNNLHNLLFESSPRIKIVETFMAIEKISDELKQFTISGPRIDDSAGTQTKALYQAAIEGTHVEPNQAFSQQTTAKSSTPDNKALSPQEAAPQQDPRKPDDPNLQNQTAVKYVGLIEALEGIMAKLKTDVEAVKSDLSEETLDAYSKNVEGIEQEINALKKHRAAVNNFNISITKLINLMHTLNQYMLNDRQKFNQELFNRIQSKLQQLKNYQDAKGLQVIKRDQEASSFYDYATALNGLNNTLRSLEQNISLTDDYQEIEKLKEIAVAINKMKASVKSINALSDIEAQPSLAKTVQNSSPEDEKLSAQLMFEKNLGVLSDAIIKLEKEFSAQKPTAMLALIIGADSKAQLKANTILTDYQSLSAFDAVLLPFKKFVGEGKYLHNFGINTRYIATLSYESLTLMFVFVIGAIGSLLYITKHFLHQAIQGHGWLDPPSRPLSWYLFRPIFGIVVALAVYLLVKAGQLALGGGDSLGDLNLPIFSVVALFAGLLSWHALDAIESRGKKWFKAQSRRHMYAAGLKHALTMKGKSIAQCANQIGCTEIQIHRWIAYQDRVTPEMQDRLITWLDLSVGELFTEDRPVKQDGDTPLLTEGPQADADGPGDGSGDK